MINPEVEISGRKIGLDYNPLVIAEMGINHEGSLKTAYEKAQTAAESAELALKAAEEA